jgi:diacylglycerol diphosphate phosphatase / phosphatidate phosphatase
MVLLMEPFHRMFSLDDIGIQFPHAEVERVPVSTVSRMNGPGMGMADSFGLGYLLVYAGVIPLLVLLLWACIFQPERHECHVTILGFMISLILSSFLTDVVKNSVGRPRPDLIARCKPEKDTPELVLVTVDICTETDHHILHDGWRSFPSGHSSFAFSGLGYLALCVPTTGHDALDC